MRSGRRLRPQFTLVAILMIVATLTLSASQERGRARLDGQRRPVFEEEKVVC